MRFVFLHISSAREAWADEAEELYRKKIGAFVSFEVTELKPKKAPRAESESKKKVESDALLSFFEPDDYVMLFDEKGDSPDSRAFSRSLERVLGSSKKRAVFVIGGAFGVSEDVRRRAQIVVSLSGLTLNHLVARTVALEQIYRGFTILRGLPYHND